MGRFILWAILLFFVVRAVSKLVRGLLEGAGYSPQIRSQQGVGLVRDPVCGVFVVPGQALAAGGKHFCSEKCRREWQQRG
jgi:hypothetical protein